MDYVYLLFYVRVDLAGVDRGPELIDVFAINREAEEHKERINNDLLRAGVKSEYAAVSRWEVK